MTAVARGDHGFVDFDLIAAAAGDPDAARLLARFAADAGQVLPLIALWAHGSLASGDFVPFRSDLDLVALIGAPVTAAQRSGLQQAHEWLMKTVPLAAELHCSYVAAGAQSDPGRTHLTWAHGEMFDRRVSPVSRRELLESGLCVLGPAPAAVIPAVSDKELADYVAADLRDYWYAKTSRADLWLRDIWVDLGMLTLARAGVTLADGRLITKREALDVLAAMGAPELVVADIRERRYGGAPSPPDEEWRSRRGDLARRFVREGIDTTLGHC